MTGNNQDRVAVVLLSFNSERDLMVSVPQFAAQVDVRHTLVVVDNASSEDSVACTSSWMKDWCPSACIGSLSEVNAWVARNPLRARAAGQVYLILNNENRGYSAGNNVGIFLAEALGVDSVLIANPDVRIRDHCYLSELTKQLFADAQNYVVASRILGLDGKDQSPLRESDFWEELLWPRFYFSRFLQPISYVLPVSGDQPVVVPKVSGCCLLLRMSYLKADGYLDEGVFLYCEEPILASRVRSAGGRIMFVPSLSVVHAHVRRAKGNSSQRMLQFIMSRRYYLKRYGCYGLLPLVLLGMSYAVLKALHTLKFYIERPR